MQLMLCCKADVFLLRSCPMLSACTLTYSGQTWAGKFTGGAAETPAGNKEPGC